MPQADIRRDARRDAALAVAPWAVMPALAVMLDAPLAANLLSIAILGAAYVFAMLAERARGGEMESALIGGAAGAALSGGLTTLAAGLVISELAGRPASMLAFLGAAIALGAALGLIRRRPSA